MALKQEGYPVSVWDDWSRRDPGRYHPGECESKWDGFRGSGNPVTGGSIVQMARSRGWQTARSKDGGAEQHGRELGWDDMIGLDEKEDLTVVDPAWLEEREIAPPEQWDPARELITYLELLFSPGDCVGYVTRSFEKDGRRLPTKGCYDRTAEQLIEQLKKCGGDLGAVLGDYDPAAGAWIRFNPLDGKGVKNDNVTAFRYALVESDTLPVEQQHAIIAFAACDLEGTGEVPQQRLMEYTGKAKTTIQNWVDEHPGFIREGGMIRRVQKEKTDFFGGVQKHIWTLYKNLEGGSKKGGPKTPYIYRGFFGPPHFGTRPIGARGGDAKKNASGVFHAHAPAHRHPPGEEMAGGEGQTGEL